MHQSSCKSSSSRSFFSMYFFYFQHKTQGRSQVQGAWTPLRLKFIWEKNSSPPKKLKIYVKKNSDSPPWEVGPHRKISGYAPNNTVRKALSLPWRAIAFSFERQYPLEKFYFSSGLILMLSISYVMKMCQVKWGLTKLFFIIFLLSYWKVEMSCEVFHFYA